MGALLRPEWADNRHCCGECSALALSVASFRAWLCCAGSCSRPLTRRPAPYAPRISRICVLSPQLGHYAVHIQLCVRAQRLCRGRGANSFDRHYRRVVLGGRSPTMISSRGPRLCGTPRAGMRMVTAGELAFMKRVRITAMATLLDTSRVMDARQMQRLLTVSPPAAHARLQSSSLHTYMSLSCCVPLHVHATCHAPPARRRGATAAWSCVHAVARPFPALLCLIPARG